jgi:hypothetical protein
LFGVFDNYNRAFDIFCFGLFLALVGWLAASRRLRLAPRLAWAAGLVFAVYLLLPSQILGGSGADHRLPIAMFLLLIAASAPEFPDRRTAAAIGVAAAVLLVGRLAFIEYVWLQADDVYTADSAGIDMLPRGSRLAVAYPASAVNFAPIPEVHLALLAVVRREAFVPILFAYEGQQPVILKPLYGALAGAGTPQDFWDFVVADRNRPDSAHAGRVLQHYDFVAVIGARQREAPSTRCLQSFFAHRRFEIFTVLHDASCATGNG